MDATDWSLMLRLKVSDWLLVTMEDCDGLITHRTHGALQVHTLPGGGGVNLRIIMMMRPISDHHVKYYLIV